MRKVVGLGIPTSSQEENKGRYPNLDDFQEMYENFMLIHHEEMMALIFCMDLFRRVKLWSMFGH
jgi:hypothetical protein